MKNFKELIVKIGKIIKVADKPENKMYQIRGLLEEQRNQLLSDVREIIKEEDIKEAFQLVCGYAVDEEGNIDDKVVEGHAKMFYDTLIKKLEEYK